jgi:hypothetical protein
MTSRGRETEKKTKVRRTFNLRLRARLILAFALIALIPLTLLTVVVIEQTQSTVTSMVNATLTDQANRIAASIASSIQQLTYDLQNLAVNPSIEQLAVIRPTSILRDLGLEGKTVEEMEEMMAETRNLEGNSRTQAFLESTVAEYQRFSQLIVVNMDGMVLAATERPDRFIHLDEHWFQAAIEQEVYISDFQQLPDKDEAGLVMSTVIYRSSSLATGAARPAGAVRGLVPMSFFSDTMVPILADIAGGELQLLSSGQVVLDIELAPKVRSSAVLTATPWVNWSYTSAKKTTADILASTSFNARLDVTYDFSEELSIQVGLVGGSFKVPGFKHEGLEFGPTREAFTGISAGITQRF